MSTFIAPTTAPNAEDTRDRESQAFWLGLVRVWSASQPHRVGDIAFFPPFEQRFLGRGDEELDKFALFDRQRPGVTYAPDAPAGLLAGIKISRRQTRVHATAVALEIEQIGNCVTYVNGEEARSASLKPGDTLMYKKEEVFVCVRRPLHLPALRGLGELHAFGEPDADGIVGESPCMWSLRHDIIQAAPGDEHVLIHGETGAGKERTAEAIHRRSERAKGPFVQHNGSSFTLTLLESQLFGHSANYPDRGAPARIGLFPSADRGTLFLDEIGECPLEVQANLLRALEVGESKPLGEAIARKVDVRVIGATHRDDSFLRADFRGRFTQTMDIPSLRERPEDIPLLLRHLMLRHAQKKPATQRFIGTGPTGRPEVRFSARLVDHLVRHSFSRNVRELGELLSKAINASPDDEVKMPFANGTATPAERAPEKETARRKGASALPSKAELVACLERERGIVSRVARILGLTRGAVYRLMESYGIKREDSAPG